MMGGMGGAMGGAGGAGGMVRSPNPRVRPTKGRNLTRPASASQDFAKMMEQMKAAGVGAGGEGEDAPEGDSSDDNGVSTTNYASVFDRPPALLTSLSPCQPPPLEEA